MIKRKIIKKVSIILLFLMLFQVFANIFTVAAASIGQSKNLERGALSDYIVQYYNGSNWSYVSSNIVTYKDETDTNRIAYCITPNTPGIEWVTGNSAGYSVNLTQMLSDARIWRVIRFGYPYVSASGLGVETNDDAYLATKLAIQCIQLNRPLDQVKVHFRAGQAPVAGLKLTDIQRRGQKVVDAVYNLVNKGYNGTETPAVNDIVSINKVGDFKQDSNSNYFSQTYNVTSKVDMSNFIITSVYNFPEGSYSTDINGNAKTVFSSGEQFKIMIPKDKITGEINGEIFIQSKCKTYPIFYGDGPSGWQDYAICTDPYGDVTASTTLKAIANNGEISINKVDGDTSKPVEGVIFELTTLDGKSVGKATTDINGKATFIGLFPGKYKLKEISTNKDYVINETIFDVNVEFGKTTIVNIPNYKKKGKIKVVKVDKDNHEVKLEGITFEVLDSKDNVVDKLVTDKNGEAVTKELPIDEEYRVRETITKKEYVLSDKVEKVKLEQDQIKTLVFENEKKKGQIKVVKVDQDKKEIKLEGVVFEVLDSKDNVVQEITTDKNGEATTKRLPIDEEYRVREKETQQTYILSDKVEKVTLEQDQIKTIIFENEKKKGNLKIYKVDKDNNRINLGNVVFDLYSNEFGKIIGTYTTNVDGEIEIKDLRVGTYKVIERTTNKWYNLAEETPVEIEWKETTEKYIENELKKGQVRVIKVDKDNNEIKLAGVKFDVLDKDGNVLETIITDENGEALTSEYAVRDFENLTLQEIETKENYVLSEETQTIELKEDQIPTIVFENEKKKGQIRVIKVDLDNQEVKLEGVKFDIKDEQGNVVDSIVTDENGEAVSKRLPIDQEYTVVETETKKEYKLTEEMQTVKLEQDEIKNLTFTNEKRKGQLRVIKVDKDNNDVLLKGVKFDIKDEQGNVVDSIVTDENGEAITKPLPIDQKYTVVETETQKEYVLTEEIQTIELKEDEITSIKFENEKVKGYIEITKVSADDNKLTGETKGTLLKNAEFEIYNESDELVDTIITDENGRGKSKLLEYGKYYIIEKNPGSDYYLLNTEKYYVEITENLVTIPVTIENNSVDIGLDIEKNGVVQAQPNDEIKYNFNSLKNTSNVALDNFTWTDNLPTDYIRITKLFTGTYNEDLDYIVKYKTNKSEDYIEYGKYNTQVNNYIDFTKVVLAEDEYITDYKIEFGTVMSGFEAIEKPFIFCKVLPTVKAEDRWTNYTSLTGNYKEHKIGDKAEWTTKSYAKKLTIKKLPKTGY